MKFIIYKCEDFKPTKEELESEGIKLELAGADDYGCYYKVEIKSLEQAVQLAEKFEKDFVICSKKDEVFGKHEIMFFRGWYEG